VQQKKKAHTCSQPYFPKVDHHYSHLLLLYFLNFAPVVNN
jgi:hypothetical protein